MSMNSMKLSPTKQLLIIGNGFDKHLGLKSLYVEYYLSLTENERKNNIFTYLASNKNYNWADVESLLLKCLIIIKKLDAQTVKNYISAYKSDSKEQILSLLVSSNKSQKVMTILEEKELIKKYRRLTPEGKETVDTILDLQYRIAVPEVKNEDAI